MKHAMNQRHRAVSLLVMILALGCSDRDRHPPRISPPWTRPTIASGVPMRPKPSEIQINISVDCSGTATQERFGALWNPVEDEYRIPRSYLDHLQTGIQFERVAFWSCASGPYTAIEAIMFGFVECE